MGTRHLICASINGETKLAQYGRWDGYPEGQGMDVLAFCQALVDDPEKYASFTENLAACRFITDDECEQITAGKMDRPSSADRDLGSDILEMIAEGETLMVNDVEFGRDGLFCEWAYWIDFDTRQVEVYRGLNVKNSMPWAENRFGEPLPDTDAKGYKNEYTPVALMHSFSFDTLPDKDSFLFILKQYDNAELEDASA
ncbi:MAG: hypothetical protein ACK5MY_02655 [Jhaorihella sp.]